MSWLEIALVVVALAGVFAGAFLIAQRPTFWVGLGVVLFKAILPILIKRMDPETEARWRECERRGGKWNHLKKRCE